MTWSLEAASAAGAGIELDGKHIGGYTVTWDGETREELVRELVNRPITFARDYDLPVDPKIPNVVVLQGRIVVYSKIRGSNEERLSTKELKLVKRKGKWFVDKNSFRRLVNPPDAD